MMVEEGAAVQQRIPGPIAWLVMVAGFVMVWPVQWIGEAMNADRGFVNIAALILMLGGVGLFLFRWLQLHGPRYVVSGIVLTLIGLIALGATVRIRRTTGSLIPDLAFRWSAEPDQTLGSLQVATSNVGHVDLSTTTPEDFPQFLGPDRLNVLHGVKLATDWTTNPPKPLWRRDIGAGWSSFAAVNGFAVTLEQRDDKEMVTCLEVKTGTPRWVSAVTARHATLLGYVGPRSTPTIAGGRVYALGATGILRCLRGEDGQEVWSHDLFATHGFTQEQAEQGVFWGRAASPLVHDGRVIVPVGGPAAGPWVTLAAYDAETGAPVWEAAGHQVSYASPSLFTFHGVPQIVIVSQDYVSSHDPATGATLWEFDWPGKSGSNANVTQAMPIDEKSLFVSKGYDGQAAVFDIAAPAEGKWSTPEKRWGKNVLKTKFSNVSLQDGFVYGLDHGLLTCIELENGRRRWKGGRYNYGQSLLVDKVLLIITEQGEIALADASPEKFQELAKISVLNDQTWNNPCLYGRYLLFRNATDAVCYEMPLADEAP